MHPETRQVAEHMREFGLSLLGRAIYDATFSEYARPFAHASSVLLAAQAAEILIKARIAEEHPLLIFNKFPSSASTQSLLTIDELFKDGKSISYEELPNLLWATTGIRICNIENYRTFGKLRNIIAHFAVPDIELAYKTLEFLLTFLEPLVYEFWKLSGISYASDWDDVIISEGYLKDSILAHGICIDARISKIINPDE